MCSTIAGLAPGTTGGISVLTCAVVSRETANIIAMPPQIWILRIIAQLLRQAFLREILEADRPRETENGRCAHGGETRIRRSWIRAAVLHRRANFHARWKAIEHQ